MVVWWRLVSCVFVAACGGSSSGLDGGGDDAPIDPDGPLPPGGAPSCKDLPATCGGSDDCCTSPIVPAGTYHRSYDVAGDASSGAAIAPATVGAFRLDRYEITVGRFRAFVRAMQGTQASPPAAGAGAHAEIANSGWDPAWNARLPATTDALIAALKCDATFATWTDAAGANEHRPINCVSWFEAMAFCIWDGGFLATEAEWNYAAAGGDEQRAYPWSAPAGSVAIDGTRASYHDGATCIGDGAAGCTLADVIEVGTKPAGSGRWGQHELAGNLQEWGLDYVNAYPMPCSDCASLTMADVRVVRGGNYRLAVSSARSGHRGGLPPQNRYPDVGARCARAR